MSKKMDKRKEFDNILDDCLERVMRGEDLTAVLALYPQYAGELKPLLETALDTRKAAEIAPRPGFRRQAALDFQKAVQSMPAKAPRNGFRWQAAWMTPLAVFLALVIAGGGTVAASGSSLPDSPLYRVKLAAESVQLAFTPSSLGKAELYAEFNDKRVDELVKMAEKGQAGQIDKLTASMASNMAAIDELTGGAKQASNAEFGLMSVPEPASVPSETAPDDIDLATQTAPDKTAEPPVRTPMATVPPVTTPAPATPPPKTMVATTEPALTFIVPPAGPPDDARKSPGHPQIDERAGDSESSDSRGRDAREEALQRLLTEKQQAALRKLYKELEDAPEWLKPSIQAAIDVILDGYNISISNLSE